MMIKPTLFNVFCVGILLAPCLQETRLLAEGSVEAAPASHASITPRAPSVGLTQVGSPGGSDTAQVLGIAFVEGSTNSVMVVRDGKRYLVDLITRTVKEIDQAPSTSVESNLHQADPPSAPQQQTATATPRKKSEDNIYEPGDDVIFSLPTGRRLDRHGFYINFSHRFPYSTAFTGKARGSVLFGLDDFALPSFGFRYGVTRRLSVSAYRSPSIIGRPIQLMAAYNFLDEHDGQPFNAAVRFSVEGQNDFQRNFTTNFEGIFSRSITKRAQLYFVPTVSLHNRPLLESSRALEDPFPYQPCKAPVAAGTAGGMILKPCANTLSLGVGGALDIRPTVALVAEVIPTVVNGRALGIHRPAYSFGIQKKIWRHAFTFGFSNSPGTTVSQRAGTRATFVGDPSADTPSGFFVGFDLTRQVY
jgi:hypothetical protein